RGHRSDEERQFVVHDLDDRVLERPAVFLDRRIEKAHLRAAGLPLFSELPKRERAAEESVEGGVDDVVGRDEREEPPDEMRGALHLLRPNSTSRLRRQALDQIGFSLFGGEGHVRRGFYPLPPTLSRKRGEGPGGPNPRS